MKKAQLILLFSMLLWSIGANAQTLINITENNIIISNELQSVQSITFLDGNLRLNLITGDVRLFGLDDVQKIDFGIISSIVDIQTPESPTALIFPNPSNGNEALNLIYQSTLQSQFTVTIYGLDGGLQKQMFFAPNDAALYSLQMQHIQPGIHFAVIQQGNLVKAVKFVIN